MKKRICFVEEDPNASRSLKGAISTISEGWDCTFVAGGAAALNALANEHFDVIVADMRMQGMNGAQVLHQSGKLHPNMVQILTGDLADQELAINCVGSPHQFIPTSFAPQEILVSIERTLAFHQTVFTPDLLQLAKRLGPVPPITPVYFEVRKEIAAGGTPQKIGEIIAHDPVVCARLLQMVNCAAFNNDQKLADPAEAVSLFGAEVVKSLLLCLNVFSESDQASPAGLSSERLWNHSFTVANMARKIAQLETHSSRMATDAFCSGLMHDIGKALLVSRLADEYSATVNAACTGNRALHEEEAARLGATHAQIGAWMLAVWGLPEMLVESVAFHHAPNKSVIREFSLLTAVHAANVLAHEQEQASALPAPTFDSSYLETLQLSGRVDRWRSTVARGESASLKAARISANATRIWVKAPTHLTAPPPLPASRINPQPLPARTRRETPLDWIWIPATPALLIIAFVMWWVTKSDPVDDGLPVQARSASTPSDPAPAPALLVNSNLPANLLSSNNPVPLKPRDPFAGVKVQAVFYRGSRSSVVINGRTLAPGEKFNGIRVISISPTSVTLATDTERRSFTVK